MTETESIAADLRADGQPMILTRVLAGAYDLVTGDTGETVTQMWTVYGITANYSSYIKQASANIPGTAILSGDKKAIFGAGTVKPIVGDTLKIMGEFWQIQGVDTLEPQGEELMHTCQVRK